MSSFLSQSSIPKWLIPYLYDMRERAFLRHSAQAKYWTGDESTFRAAMFADTFGSWYVMENATTVTVFIGKEYHRSTRLYHRYNFDKATRKQTSYKEVRFGETAGVFRRFDHIWIINGVGEYKAKPVQLDTSRLIDDLELSWFKQISREFEIINLELSWFKQISSLIQQSPTYVRAIGIAQTRLAAKDFEGCSEVCTWLQETIQEDSIIKYVLHGYMAGFEVGSFRHFRPSISWILRRYMEAKDPKVAAAYKRKIVLHAMDVFKKDFSKNVYGKLVKKLSN